MQRFENHSAHQVAARDFTQRLESALAGVCDRIACECAKAGRRPEEIAIMAVTKGFGPEAIEAAIATKLSHVGENYYQEAAAKFARVAWPKRRLDRHFIGRIQRNKARRIAALFDVVQTVDSVAIAQELDRGTAESGKASLDVLIQLNIASDDRSGIPPGECVQFARELRRLNRLRLRGVMAVGPLDRAAIPEAFATAARCYRGLQDVLRGVDCLSLGMSADLSEAVAAGTTMVRLGSALFGERPKKEGW